MYRFIRRLLPLVLMITCGVVVLGASPAAAGKCNPDPWLTPCSLTNGTSISVVGVNAWCDGSVQYLETELMNCENPPEDNDPKVYSILNHNQTATNVDAYRADANCITNGTGWSDRRGKGSVWVKFPDFLAVTVTDKTCYAPTGLSVLEVAQQSVTIGWNALLYDDGSRAPVDFRVRRNGTIVYAGHGDGSSTLAFYTDSNLAIGSTYTYTVSILYGTGYEGPYAQIGPVTTPTPPPPPPPPGPGPNEAPSYTPYINPYSFTLYWITTFQAAPTKIGVNQVGTLNASNWNYVYCKEWAGEVRYGNAYNHWWMWTDSDVGPSGWVSAYWLTLWGNDQALDNWGGDIPRC